MGPTTSRKDGPQLVPSLRCTPARRRWYVASIRSFLTTAASSQTYRSLAEVITGARPFVCEVTGKPVELYPAEASVSRTAGRCDVRLVPVCDHFYVDREDISSQVVSEWLGARL